MAAAAGKSRILNGSELIWLLIALIVHALLFTLPLQQQQDALRDVIDASKLPVFINLTRPQVKKPAQPVMPSEKQVTVPETQPRPATITEKIRDQPQEPASSPADTIKDLVPDEAEETPVKHLSTALLLHSVEDGSWTVHLPPEDGRTLGQPDKFSLPANWQKGTGAKYFNPEDNMFNGMVAPATVEVLDHWVATDGSRNIVFNSPDGNTYCGRAEYADPMRPQFVPLMMFRPCGGGGKRTFDMSAPKSYSRDFIDSVVNSTTDQ
jgi:hypothetical protein